MSESCARRRIASALSIGGLVFAATIPGAAQAKSSRDVAMSAFTSQKCTLCHSIAGRGNPKGTLDSIGGKLTADEIRQWITDPDAMRAKTHATRTPPMKKAALSKEQVDALVAYLQTLKSTNATGAGK